MYHMFELTGGGGGVGDGDDLTRDDQQTGSVTIEDIFKMKSGELPVKFVAAKQSILRQNMIFLNPNQPNQTLNIQHNPWFAETFSHVIKTSWLHPNPHLTGLYELRPLCTVTDMDKQ